MSESVSVGKPGESGSGRRRINSVFVAIATLVALDGMSPSVARAQKFIDFSTSGSVEATLLFSNFITPDVYMFSAEKGDRIRVETSDADFDTTVRVIGPDASVNLFDDDSGAGTASSLTFTAADTGYYILVVTSYSGNPGGGYYVLDFARGSLALQPGARLRDAGQGEHRPELYNPEEVKPIK